MEYNFKEIGNRIREMRKSKNWSQEDFASDILHISRNTLSAIENGKQEKFTLDILLSCCSIFSCDMGYLLGEYGDCKTRDNQFVHKVTGLSEYAIKQLHNFNSNAFGDGQSILQLINWLMQDPRFTVSLTRKMITYCQRYIDLKRGNQISKEDHLRLSEMSQGNELEKLKILMSGAFTHRISDNDLANLNDLKDSAYMQAQRAFDAVLDCLVFHHCKKEGL